MATGPVRWMSLRVLHILQYKFESPACGSHRLDCLSDLLLLTLLLAAGCHVGLHIVIFYVFLSHIRISYSIDVLLLFIIVCSLS